MKSLIQRLLAGESPEGVVELCLDYALTKSYTPEKFTSMAGVEGFKDLEHLSISGQVLNQLIDFHGLHHLKSLNLSANELEACDSIHDLPKLAQLDLSQNLLSELKGLKGLPMLQELNVSHNHVMDLGDLPLLPALTSLKINHNRNIKLLQPLRPYSKTLRQLYVHQCFVLSFEPLADLLDLETLSLSPAHSADLFPLSHLSNLQNLTIHANRLNGHLEIPTLLNVNRLEIIGGPNLSSIQFKDSLPNLRILSLKRNSLTEIPDLHACPNLIELDISDNPITQLPSDFSLAKLHRIRAKNTGIPSQEWQGWMARNADVEVIR